MALAGASHPAGAGRLLGLGVARGVASLLGFLGITLVARALAPDDLGRWSLALAVAGFALHLGEFGLRSVATTELDRAGARWRLLLRRYLALRLTLTALVLGLVLTGAHLARPESFGLIAAATLATVATALQLDWIALVDDRRGLVALALLARPLAFLLLLLAWPGEPDVAAVAACYLAAWWLAAGLSWPALRQRPAPVDAGSVPAVRSMLHQGAPLMLVTLTNQAQLSADLMVAGWSLGLAAAGDYYLASQIAVAGLLFANTANQVALARLPRWRNEPELFAAALAQGARQLLLVACLLATALGFAGPWLLRHLFGAEHAGAGAALLALLPWLVLQHLSQLLQGALTAAGCGRAVLRANLVSTGLLAAALAAAAAGGSLAGFALARALGEAARCWSLHRALRRAGLTRR